MAEGQIIKALSGFYYVKSENNIYACKGRGLFRKQKITPLVGDNVYFDITENNEGVIQEIKPRKNELIRPQIANITQAIIVTSATQPDFSSLLLDRFVALMESEFIKPYIVITKIDLATKQQLTEIEYFKAAYEKLGYNVFLVSLNEIKDLPKVESIFKNETSVITGQTGVGKSTLLNVIDPNLNIETSEVSASLGRGKHTTRHVELIEINNGLVADTPGFSQLELTNIDAVELSDTFIEMKKLKGECRFRGCLHKKEPHCAVKQAVEAGHIEAFRYEHYLKFLEEIQSRKPRY